MSPPTSPLMSPEERQTHLTYMREALSMASHALNNNETPVGCILVHTPTSSIISRGYNFTNRSFNGTRHAEYIAISSLLSQTKKNESGEEERVWSPEVLRECDLYVTVEPCIMCASLLRQFGIKRVFFGAGNEKFGGTGGVLNIQKNNGKILGEEEGKGEKEGKKEWDYEVSGGWLREEAIVMLRRFYVQENGNAPEPRSKGNRVLKLDVEPLGEGRNG